MRRPKEKVTSEWDGILSLQVLGKVNAGNEMKRQSKGHSIVLGEVFLSFIK